VERDTNAGTMKKIVQTVEERSSAQQPLEEGVLKTVQVVHQVPAKDTTVKQDQNGLCSQARIAYETGLENDRPCTCR
jgi:hypothetical protein